MERQYKYLVNFVIDVKRTDNAMLTDEENAMIHEIRDAIEKTIGDVMRKHGNKGSKNIGTKTVIY